MRINYVFLDKELIIVYSIIYCSLVLVKCGVYLEFWYSRGCDR